MLCCRGTINFGISDRKYSDANNVENSIGSRRLKKKELKLEPKTEPSSFTGGRAIRFS